METPSIAEVYMSVFEGFKTAHGKYILPKEIVAGQKAKGQGVSVHAPVTLHLWEQHLAGKQYLGITPINADNKCRFGVVDIDVYDIDIVAMAKTLAKDKIPVTLIRSKSGGPQLYLFTQGFVPAKLMQDKLHAIAAYVGHGAAEIFPKQSEILSGANDVGSWINMPYFNQDNTVRYALDSNGKAMTSKEFLEHVAKSAISEIDLKTYELPLPKELDDAPPCLQILAVQGIPEGQRNTVMLNFAIYEKKKSPDNWQAALDIDNARYFVPPLPSSELQGVVGSLKKKDYHPTCKQTPLCTNCNVSLCRTRKYGVGGGVGAPNVNSVTLLLTEPPIYFVEVHTGNGPRRLMFTTEELQTQKLYQKKLMDTIQTVPKAMKQSVWEDILQTMLEKADKIPMPDDTTLKGQFIEYLEKFCLGRSQAGKDHEILIGKPWLYDGKHYFRLSDLIAFLVRSKFEELSRSVVVTFIREIEGATHERRWIKGKNCNLWVVPQFKRMVGEIESPEQPSANVF